MLDATAELSPRELQALFVLKKRQKRRNEIVDPNVVPSLELAVRWIAEIGGYVVYNKSPPSKHQASDTGAWLAGRTPEHGWPAVA